MCSDQVNKIAELEAELQKTTEDLERMKKLFGTGLDEVRVAERLVALTDRLSVVVSQLELTNGQLRPSTKSYRRPIISIVRTHVTDLRYKLSVWINPYDE